jgi:GH15 family glucan-1,4-alpha-glucosidase
VEQRYPPIDDYGLIGDCHGTALVSRWGSIDWCCMPRFDSDSCFGRLLDWDGGGYCSVAPSTPYESTRRYLRDTLVLETTFLTDTGKIRLLDCFAMRPGGRQRPHRQILRVVDVLEGEANIDVTVAVRFDFGELHPWIRRVDEDQFVAVGSDDGLVIWSDIGLQLEGAHDLVASLSMHAGERRRLSIQFEWPQNLDRESRGLPDPGHSDDRVEETILWWRRWTARGRFQGRHRDAAMRSAIALKALNYAPTGAIIAAPTTSLPESPGGERNWDYRYSWVRDSTFTVGSLSALGFSAEADGFRRFIQRTAAGSPDELQIMYRIDGNRRIPELTLDVLEGYRGSRPVRVGNDAAKQLQLDVYGELLELAWRWKQRGRWPDQDYWRFLCELVDSAAGRWQSTDHGFWEVRSTPQHFVHSKVMCWVALDRGIRLAQECGLEAPMERWKETRDEILTAVETHGYDSDRGVFVRAFGSKDMDASLLLMPPMGFVDYEDPRMLRTVDAIRTELEVDGLVLRYRSEDGLRGDEGTFLACTFWLVECLARAGRMEEAVAVCEHAEGSANDLGLFAEEYFVDSRQVAGNFPQGLTHLSHISAIVALADS